MAYSGSTAASSVANPPRAAAGFFSPRSTGIHSSTDINGQNLWLYNTTDQSTALMASNFFSDAQPLGMKEGDLIMGCISTGSSVSVYVGVIGAVTSDGAAIASSGGALSSTR